jgi:hypothetical protein
VKRWKGVKRNTELIRVLIAEAYDTAQRLVEVKTPR